jgi:hypothetical protein
LMDSASFFSYPPTTNPPVSQSIPWRG